MFRKQGSLWAGQRFVGEVDGYYVEVQVFDEPSSYGIAEGRISRLYIYPERSAGFQQRRTAAGPTNAPGCGEDG